MSENYIENHFADIQTMANVIECRLDDSDLDKEVLIAENRHNLAQCARYNCNYILIEDSYEKLELI
jgi:hypothetical protein